MPKLLRVSCAIILKDNAVLCGQRSENMSHPLKWEFPGGKVEENELPEAALHRELREELNITVAIKDNLGSFRHRYSDKLEVELLPFVCQIINGELQAYEHKEIRWVPKNCLDNLDWVEADIPIMLKFKTLYACF